VRDAHFRGLAGGRPGSERNAQAVDQGGGRLQRLLGWSSGAVSVSFPWWARKNSVTDLAWAASQGGRTVSSAPALRAEPILGRLPAQTPRRLARYTQTFESEAKNQRFSLYPLIVAVRIQGLD
jgi:hypothetical protein